MAGHHPPGAVGASRIDGIEPALHAQDFHPDGFEWLDCDDFDRVILSWVRWEPGWKSYVAVVVNLTPVPRPDFKLPAPFAGRHRVLLNTDAPEYGAPGDLYVPPELDTRPERCKGRDQVIDLVRGGQAVASAASEGQGANGRIGKESRGRE